MKQSGMYILFIGILMGSVFLACEDDSVNVLAPNPSDFRFVDFNDFRHTAPDTVMEIYIKTMIIRRPEFKCGIVGIAFDSALSEYIPTCSPYPGCGDSSCPTFYQYFLVDSVWFGGNPEEKFTHRIDLREASFPDTTFSGIGYPLSPGDLSDPSIAKLDSLLNRPMYATISITKRRIPSHDGLNYSVDVNGSLHQFWIW